jgi:hypothetical protein
VIRNMKNTKMKNFNKYILAMSFLFTIYYSLVPVALSATTPTPLPSKNQLSSDSAELEKIQKIKDIVASKVAELKLVEKRGIIGTLKDVSGMQLTIVDVKSNIRHLEVDELTKFSFSSKSSAGISDLVKGDMYSFVGLYNKETQKLLVRVIDSVDTLPVYFEGAISSVDSKNYQLSAVDAKGATKNIDIENSTKTSLATTDGDLTKSGFSKLSVNERILAVGFWDKKDKDLLSSLRIIHFKDVPPSKEMQSHINVASTSAK